MHTLPTHIFGSEEDFEIPLSPDPGNVLPSLRIWDLEVLDMIMLMSTTHIHSGLQPIFHCIMVKNCGKSSALEKFNQASFSSSTHTLCTELSPFCSHGPHLLKHTSLTSPQKTPCLLWTCSLSYSFSCVQRFSSVPNSCLTFGKSSLSAGRSWAILDELNVWPQTPYRYTTGNSIYQNKQANKTQIHLWLKIILWELIISHYHGNIILGGYIVSALLIYRINYELCYASLYSCSPNWENTVTIHWRFTAHSRLSSYINSLSFTQPYEIYMTMFASSGKEFMTYV